MLSHKNSLMLLMMKDGIYTDEFGFIKSFKISDICSEYFAPEDYEKFMTTMCLTPDIFGVQESIGSLSLYFSKFNDNGNITYIKFSDGFRFLEPFDINRYFLIGLDKIFEKVEVIADGLILINEKILLTDENFDALRDIVLRMNKREVFKIDKEKLKKEYKDDLTKKRFETYNKHRIMRMRKNIPTYDYMAIVVLSHIGFDKKNQLSNMNIYDFLLIFDCINADEVYEKNYSKYLVGVDPKSLDLTHWSEKIKQKWSDSIG